MLQFLAAAAVQAAVPTVPPPPQAAVLTLEAPSPRGTDTAPRIVAVPRVPSFAEVPPVVVKPVRVRVTAGRQLLFDGVLRVAKNSGASYTENRNEAPSVTCPTVRSYGSSDRQSLAIQLSARDDSQLGAAVHVDVTWTRPSNTSSCFGQGARSVSLGETVPLQPGQTAVVRGDAGLTVSLTSE